jgi:mono/diheme cytochrome c family protein
MTTRRFPVQLGLLAGLFFPLSLPNRLCAWPAALPAQTVNAKLFQQHCAKCHGADGTGSPARGIEPKIPDFTAASWQAQRSDAQLLVSIRDGKGSTMPAFGTKLKEEQVRGLVAHIRAFAPTKAAPKDAPAMSVEERLHNLEKQLEELRKQYDELSKGSAAGPTAKSRRLRQAQIAPPMAPMAAKFPAAGQLFQRHCVKCHGADGTGSPARADKPNIPDFTAGSWQAKRSDAQLLGSILDGKGSTMPAFRTKLKEEQVRALIAHVRVFATKTDHSEQDPVASTSTGPADAEPPDGFL